MIHDLKSRRFGQLLVLKRSSRLLPDGKRVGIWLCRCDCGRELWPRTSSLLNGNTKSCGCQRQLKAGHTRGDKRSPTYSSWMAMKQRCSNPNNSSYPLYGARGIKVCKRWLGEHGFENFLADMGERPEGKTIDRFPDKRGNYTPNNCRWATAAQQMQNSKTAKLNVAAAAEIRKLASLGFKHRTLAELFGVCKPLIANVINKQAWRTS